MKGKKKHHVCDGVHYTLIFDVILEFFKGIIVIIIY